MKRQLATIERVDFSQFPKKDLEGARESLAALSRGELLSCPPLFKDIEEECPGRRPGRDDRRVGGKALEAPRAPRGAGLSECHADRDLM